MRHYAVAALAACAAAVIGGEAQAQQPGPPATVPDQMPFNIPYGNSITADRAAEVVKIVMAEARKGRATGSSPSPSSIPTASSSIFTRWRIHNRRP